MRLLLLILISTTAYGQQVDTTGGYISYPINGDVCNYELLTRAHLKQHKDVNRNTIKFWPASVDKTYKHSNYSRGHISPYENLSYSYATAKASMNLIRNCRKEPQAQNIGTELACEDLGRRLALQFDSVQIYEGTAGGEMPHHYWKIIIRRDTLCYWMPTTGKVGYESLGDCKVTLSSLIDYLGYDPIDRLKQWVK